MAEKFKYRHEYNWAAQVLYVQDGDTVYFALDKGFGYTQGNPKEPFRGRLYNVYCPEEGEPGYNDAKLFAQLWLSEVSARCGCVIVRTLKTRNEREIQTFGRYVVLVIDPETGLTLNDELIANAKAELWHMDAR